MRRSTLVLAISMLMAVILSACQVEGLDVASSTDDGAVGTGGEPTKIVLMRFFGDAQKTGIVSGNYLKMKGDRL